MNIKLDQLNLSNYSISKDGVLFFRDNQIIKPSDKYLFSLKNDDNKWITKSLKSIYRYAFSAEFCIDNIRDFPGEQWKPLRINNKYLVSNYGRVKSLCKYKSIILKPFENKKGYLIVKINNKNYFIHRLVAQEFIPNDNIILDTIHHKDTNKKNNYVNNLQWMSRSDNSKEAQQRKRDKK